MGRAACVIAALASMALAGEAGPSFLTHHKLLTPSSDIFVQVRIPPESNGRTIALEAWLLESEEPEPQENGIISEWMIPTIRKRIERPRYSREDVAPRQLVYGFQWKPLDAGDYELVAVLTVAGGRTLTSKPSLIMVR